MSTNVFSLPDRPLAAEKAQAESTLQEERVRELKELEVAEGLVLPLPAQWIAKLEAQGYTVDLATGQWTDTAGIQYWPTEVAYNLSEGGIK